MRAVPLPIVAVLLASYAAAAAAPCSFNGHDLSGVPAAKFQMPQVVPSNPGLNADKAWYVSLCSPTTVTTCGDHNNGYVIEAEPGSVTCSVGFDTASPTGWIAQYGGAHTDLSGQFQQPGDRRLNLTLVCDRSATTLQPDVNRVVAHPSPASPNLWTFDMRLRTNAICGDAPVPPPTPAPLPTPPSPAGRCTINGHEVAIPSATLSIPQVVQSQPGLNLTFDWAISLCTPATTAQCGPQWWGYVVQSLPGGGPCEGAFTNYTASDWRPLYGGANAMIDGTYKTYGDRILNVTLVCDPSAPTLQPIGAVVAHQWFDDPMVWIFDMRLATNATCGPGSL